MEIDLKDRNFMKTYFEKKNSITINELLKNRTSFCPKDFRIFEMPNNNVQLLKSFLTKKEVVGKEIGSDSYMPKSIYTFIKTSNIEKLYRMNEDQFEYCVPNEGINPIKQSILITKDGGKDGLGDVCLYDRNSNKDYISSGILNIKVDDKYLYYIIGYLKHSHFKTFVDLKTPEGSTIRHSKKIALEYPIVIPDDKLLLEISNVVKNIIDKEKNIINKHNRIDLLINSELVVEADDSVRDGITIEQIRNNCTRFDAGMYAKDYKKIFNTISNYKNGYYTIPLEKIKSGNTPSERIININAKYQWVTPTDISDFGFFYNPNKISMPKNNNINKDCLLFINRTSRGGKGEYVGVSMFYDYQYYGKGHHNQGIYKVDFLDRNELLYICAYMNSSLLRKMCGKISYGTKMREMKSIDFSKVPIANINEDVKKEIVDNYYSGNVSDLSFDFAEKEKAHNENVGIFQLEQEIIMLKDYLNSTIDHLIQSNIIKE